MAAKLARHPMMIAAMLIAAATGAMGFAAMPTAEPALAYNLDQQLAFDANVVDDGIDQVIKQQQVATDPAELSDAQLECLAKVVLHEAGNQPRQGQLAVAQLIMNRVAHGRFGETVCQVVNQPGQFFRTASYNPRRDSAAWANAVEVSRQAMGGQGEAVVPGAIFFHAAYAAPNAFFRTRTRLTTVGDHVFYR
jgi:N-acetylmuramoyl-L-alanine amidase